MNTPIASTPFDAEAKWSRSPRSAGSLAPSSGTSSFARTFPGALDFGGLDRFVERAQARDARIEALRHGIDHVADAEGDSDPVQSVLEECTRRGGAIGGLVSVAKPGGSRAAKPIAVRLHGKRLSIDAWLEASEISSVTDRSVDDPTGVFGGSRPGEEPFVSLVHDDWGWWPDALNFMQRIGARQCLSLPIRSRGQVTATLVLWLSCRERPAPGFVTPLRTSAQQVAVFLELLRFRDATREKATEMERARMAGEIHDGIAQVFVAVLMQARAAKMGRPSSNRNRSFFDRIESLAKQGLEEAHRSVFALRAIPVEKEGLVAALERMLDNQSIAGRTRCSLSNGKPPIAIPPTLEDAVYRIVQEATQNALKHARARQVKVRLDADGDHFLVSIEDDGIGIPNDAIQQARNQGGFRAMRERAECCGGRVVVESRVPRGTRVTAMFDMGSTRR